MSCSSTKKYSIRCSNEFYAMLKRASSHFCVDMSDIFSRALFSANRHPEKYVGQNKKENCPTYNINNVGQNKKENCPTTGGHVLSFRLSQVLVDGRTANEIRCVVAMYLSYQDFETPPRMVRAVIRDESYIIDEREIDL